MPMPCPWDQQNYQGQRLNEDDLMKGRLCPCRYDDGKHVSFGVQDQNGAGQANWKPCLFLQDSKTFGSRWMSIKTSWQMAWRTDHSSSPMQLKSSVLVASDICWWVQGQTLHMWKDITLIARFMGSTWGPSGAERAQVGPMLTPWTLLSGGVSHPRHWWNSWTPRPEWWSLPPDSLANIIWDQYWWFQSWACVKTFSCSDHTSVWDFCLGVLSDIQMLPNVFGLSREKHDIQVA